MISQFLWVGNVAITWLGFQGLYKVLIMMSTGTAGGRSASNATYVIVGRIQFLLGCWTEDFGFRCKYSLHVGFTIQTDGYIPLERAKESEHDKSQSLFGT